MRELREEKVSVFGILKTFRLAMIDSGCEVTGRFDGEVVWFRVSGQGASLETGIRRQRFETMVPADVVQWVLDFRWAWDREYGHINDSDVCRAERVEPVRYRDD